LQVVTVTRARRATRLQFLVLGIAAGTWGTHIPSVSARYLLNDAKLSLVLLAVAAGTVSALFFAGTVIARIGARNTTVVSGLAMGLSLSLLLEYPGMLALVAAMLVFGASMSLFDVAINAEGSELESLGGRPVMSGFHGMYSVGGMLGAGFTFGLLQTQVVARLQLVVVGSCLAIVALAASRAMLETHPSTDGDATHFAWPNGVLLLIGALVFSGMTAEGVLYDWSVLYLQHDVGMPQAHAALGYATFTGSMALARFCGDELRARFPERAVLRWSASVAAVAMAIVLLSARGWIGFVGLAAVGAGLAPVAPILFNAATRVPGVTRAAAIASVTTIGYSGFLVGPPIIGSIATLSSLTTALWLVVLAAGIVAYGARFVPEKPRENRSLPS
jgi:fucose permease